MQSKYLTKNEVREYFWASGLTYEKVMKQHLINRLGELIDIELSSYNSKRVTPHFINVIKKSLLIKNYSGFRTVFILGKGSYFPNREIISFNKQYDTNTYNQHFIGFCGECDNDNMQPILKAFMKWCKEIIKSEVN